MTDKIAVATMDSSQKNSPVVEPVSDEVAVVMNKVSAVCLWNGQPYPAGTMGESDGTVYECSFGQWAKQA